VLVHLAPNQPKRCSNEERAARAAQLQRSTAWVDVAMAESVQEALTTPWILDCDATINVVHGHQDGAKVSYNPQKPGSLWGCAATRQTPSLRTISENHVAD
jgi:SH3-like domain-containing protein